MSNIFMKYNFMKKAKDPGLFQQSKPKIDLEEKAKFIDSLHWNLNSCFSNVTTLARMKKVLKKIGINVSFQR
jgi:hypothetical protein